MPDFDWSKYESQTQSPEFDWAQYENKSAPVKEHQMLEPEGFWSKLPRNILTGLTHMGRNVANLPHDLVQGFEQATSPFGNVIGQLNQTQIATEQRRPLSSYLPYDPESYADVFGQQGEGTLLDNIIQKAIEYAPEIMGGRALLKSALHKFPVTQQGAARQLRMLDKIMKEHNLNTPISAGLIEEATPFLPKTHATKQMLEGAAQGEYQPAFSLQSQIGHHERNLRKSPLAAERLLAPQARELKQSALQEMQKALQMEGSDKALEAADLLAGGINDYRKYIKFRDTVKPIIKKIGIPGSLMAMVGLGIRQGKKLLD